MKLTLDQQKAISRTYFTVEEMLFKGQTKIKNTSSKWCCVDSVNSILMDQQTATAMHSFYHNLV